MPETPEIATVAAAAPLAPAAPPPIARPAAPARDASAEVLRELGLETPEARAEFEGWRREREKHVPEVERKLKLATAEIEKHAGLVRERDAQLAALQAHAFDLELRGRAADLARTYDLRGADEIYEWIDRRIETTPTAEGEEPGPVVFRDKDFSISLDAKDAWQKIAERFLAERSWSQRARAPGGGGTGVAVGGPTEEAAITTVYDLAAHLAAQRQRGAARG